MFFHQPPDYADLSRYADCLVHESEIVFVRLRTESTPLDVVRGVFDSISEFRQYRSWSSPHPEIYAKVCPQPVLAYLRSTSSAPSGGALQYPRNQPYRRHKVSGRQLPPSQEPRRGWRGPSDGAVRAYGGAHFPLYRPDFLEAGLSVTNRTGLGSPYK